MRKGTISRPEDLENYQLIESRRCCTDGRSRTVEQKNGNGRSLRVLAEEVREMPVGESGPCSWICDLYGSLVSHALKWPLPPLMLCCCLEILNNFLTRDPTFSFCTKACEFIQ